MSLKRLLTLTTLFKQLDFNFLHERSSGLCICHHLLMFFLSFFLPSNCQTRNRNSTRRAQRRSKKEAQQHVLHTAHGPVVFAPVAHQAEKGDTDREKDDEWMQAGSNSQLRLPPSSILLVPLVVLVHLPTSHYCGVTIFPQSVTHTTYIRTWYNLQYICTRTLIAHYGK